MGNVFTTDVNKMVNSNHSLNRDQELSLSANSIMLDAAQRNDMTARFTKAILKNLPSTEFVDKTVRVSNGHLLNEFQRTLKTYTDTVKRDATDRWQRLGSETLCRLIHEISVECGEGIFGERSFQEENEIHCGISTQTEDMPHGLFNEKVKSWKSSTLENQMDTSDYEIIKLDNYGRLDMGASSDSSGSSATEVAPGETVFGIDGNDTSHNEVQEASTHLSSANSSKVFDYLTSHPAFSDLVSMLWESIARHHGGQMDMIRNRISKCFQACSPDARKTPCVHLAKFIVDWDIAGFLESQYEFGLSHDIGTTLAPTGQLVNAQLLPVRSYLEQTWPCNFKKAWEPEHTSALNNARMVGEVIETKQYGESWKPLSPSPETV
jgi:hypothetical protein